MIFDNIDLSKLPPSREEAFIIFEKQARIFYEQHSSEDRSIHYDQDGDYNGSYEPERAYVICILAFLDEYELEIDVPDITGLNNNEFLDKFIHFKSKIDYTSQRFSLRKNRMVTGTVGTIISISFAYKSEIGDLLRTIRKIVNQEVHNINKRDKIFSKIASLQSEIDREQTTIDALFGRMIDLSKIVGECAENLEPALKKIERIKKIFWDKPKKVTMLPSNDRTKLLSQQEEKSDLDDEIPF